MGSCERRRAEYWGLRMGGGGAMKVGPPADVIEAWKIFLCLSRGALCLEYSSTPRV